MRSTDVLDQIDAALHDHTVSRDAMRCTPGADEPEGRAAVAQGIARSILVQRLTDYHGLALAEARAAVLAVENGRTSEHAALVRAEARAVAEEATQRIRIAIQHRSRSLGPTLRYLCRNPERPPAGDAPAARHERPAWQSPYGPVLRRR
ncbi:hypothetical protein [Streptomyces sp. NPDC047028]|uniref:hypothetical protein n=1 Tax=Streptomyces sp. NPDC047028 TaxID=3155793 RepID=UPI0033F9D7E1